MLIQKIQIAYISISILNINNIYYLFKESHENILCSCCGCELDIEDYFFNNICDSCGASQGYDREYFENSELNNFIDLKNDI